MNGIQSAFAFIYASVISGSDDSLGLNVISLEANQFFLSGLNLYNQFLNTLVKRI